MSDLLTIAEVAALLNISPETVTRRFAKVKGVIDMGSPDTPRRRRYRVLRIPRQVVERWVLLRGGRIQIEPVQAKPRRAKIAPPPSKTEDDLVHDLATLAQQHGDAARKTLERIARRARSMTFVPPDRWQDIVSLDDGDE
jgi:hypothetical protein